MLKVKLSSKRQATFPRNVCESLGLKPGDEILLEPTGDTAEWTLRPAKARSRPWLHRLRPYAAENDHSMDAVRGSIAKGRGKR